MGGCRSKSSLVSILLPPTFPVAPWIPHKVERWKNWKQCLFLFPDTRSGAPGIDIEAAVQSTLLLWHQATVDEDEEGEKEIWRCSRSDTEKKKVLPVVYKSSSSSSSSFFPDGSAPGVTASITEKQRKKLHFLPSKETQSTWKLFYNSSTTLGNGLWTVKFIIKKYLNCTPCLHLLLHPLEAVHPLRHTFVHEAATSLSPLVTYRSFFCSLKPRRRKGMGIKV